MSAWIRSAAALLIGKMKKINWRQAFCRLLYELYTIFRRENGHFDELFPPTLVIIENI